MLTGIFFYSFNLLLNSKIRGFFPRRVYNIIIHIQEIKKPIEASTKLQILKIDYYNLVLI